MTEKFNEDRWNTFENSGRVADYLYYKGIGSSELPKSRGELSDNAHNHSGRSDIGTGRRG